MKNMQRLWEEKFNYKVIANEISKDEYIVDQEVIDEKIDDAKKLLRDEKKAFDGLIFIYSGHGYESGIITSYNQRVKLSDIEKEFSPKKIKRFAHCPKIFIIDACRSYSQCLPAHNEERLRVESKTSEKREKKGNNSTRWHHPLLNTIEVFGNTRGYSVSGGSDSGGSLLREISNTFEQYISSKPKVFERKTFQQLFNPIKRQLHENQHGNQLVQFQDTLNGTEVYISPKKK